MTQAQHRPEAREARTWEVRGHIARKYWDSVGPPAALGCVPAAQSHQLPEGRPFIFNSSCWSTPNRDMPPPSPGQVTVQRTAHSKLILVLGDRHINPILQIKTLRL